MVEFLEQLMADKTGDLYILMQKQEIFLAWRRIQEPDKKMYGMRELASPLVLPLDILLVIFLEMVY